MANAHLTASMPRRLAVSRNVRAVLAVGLIAALPLLISYPFLGEPMLKDEAVYFSVAMFDGLPYTGVFDHKPPLIYAWYELALLLNAGEPSIRVVHTLAALNLCATTLAVMWVGRLAGGPRMGLLAGLMMCACAANQYLQFNGNSEVFMIAPLTLSLGCFLAGVRDGRMSWFALAGVLAGIATMTKTVGAVHVVALAGVLGWAAANQHIGWRASLQAAGALLAGAIVVVGLISAPWAVTGHWHEFWYANVTYNLAYGAESSTFDKLLAVGEVDRHVIAGGLIVWVLAAAGVVLLCVRGASVQGAALMASAAAAVIGVSSTGREYAHYWVQAAPFASLLAAVTLVQLGERWRSFRHRMHAEALLGGLAFLTIIALMPLYIARGDDAHLVKHDNADEARRAIANREIAAYVGSISEPGDTLLNFGLETQIYVLADRRPAVYHLRPVAAVRVEPESFDRMMRELEAAPPRVIIDTARVQFPGGDANGIAMLPSGSDIASPYRARFDAFLAERYELVRKIAYADVYVLR